MKLEKPLETWIPERRDLSSALNEFVPIVKNVNLSENEFEDAIPVSLPKINGLQFLSCVYAPTHQDLSHPRYSVLAPIVTANEVYLYVEKNDQTFKQLLKPNELIIIDSHLPHGLTKPKNFPEQKDLNELSFVDKVKLKRNNMSFFLCMDYVSRPNKKQVEDDFARLLHLPVLRNKHKFR